MISIIDMVPIVIQFSYGQISIENALHSLISVILPYHGTRVLVLLCYVKSKWGLAPVN